MKRILTGIIALAALASANAQTPISSVNAAGYIKVTVQTGKFYLLQTPFNKFDGSSITLDDLLGTSLPDSSEVYVWNLQTQTFVSSIYFEGDGFFPNQVVERGQGFFVKPVSVPASTFDLFLAGEVPGASTAASTTISLLPGFNTIGFPYPVATTLKTSGLTESTVDSDEVYMYNSDTQSYNSYIRVDDPGFEWGGNGNEDVVINPGSALFVKKLTGGQTYSATVPYSWPNN